MKKIILLLSLLVVATTGFAQKVRISGTLLNCPDKKLELVMWSEDGDLSDSILVDAQGSFSYQTDQITKPMQASITNRKQIQIQLFLAPGYDLMVTSDVKDYKIGRATIKYSGIGGSTNGYWQKLFKNYKPDTVKWAAKDANTYAAHLLEKSKFPGIRDSIFGVTNKDPFKDHFKKALELDEQFGPLTSVFSSYAYENNYTWAQIEDLLKKIGKSDFRNQLNNEKNLISSSFRYFVESFAFYCDTYNAFPADSLVKKDGNYTLYLSSKFFKGKVYDYVAIQALTRQLSSTYKFDDIQKLTPYIHLLGTEAKVKIEKLVKQRELSATGLQAGNPSPGFKLADPKGKYFNLSDFKGKVVYIDMWASWCGPCREENPFLKKVYEKYKNNDKIVIISIAAFDAKNRDRRYEIMKKEQMSWLQLEDTEDAFAKSYQASFIPRFIIIDKNGNIVDSDAPRPSEGAKLTDILNKEIGR